MNNIKPIVAALLIAGLTACSMAPTYQRPNLPVAAQAGNAAEAKTLIPEWKAWFSDAQLQAVIDKALANNRDLRVAVANVEAAQAQYGIQKAARLPTLNVNANHTSAHTPASLSSTGADLVSRQYGVNLGLAAYELDFWGRVKSLSSAALESYLATEEGQRATRLSLIANVASSYYASASLAERVEFARKTVTAREENQKVIASRVAAGTANRLDGLNAETALDTAKNDLAALSNQLEQALNNLSVLTGEPVAAPKLASQLPVAPQLPAGLSSEVLLKRPDILQAEHTLKAANANIGAARAAFFPSISLTGSFGLAHRELDGLFTSSQRAWSFTPSIRLPIFDGGSNRANLDLATARKNAAVAQYEKAIQQAFAEVANVLADQRWITEQLDIQQRQAARQEERLQLAQTRYQAGLVGYLDVLDAQRDHYSAQQALLELQRSRLAAAAQAYKVLGGI